MGQLASSYYYPSLTIAPGPPAGTSRCSAKPCLIRPAIDIIHRPRPHPGSSPQALGLLGHDRSYGGHGLTARHGWCEGPGSSVGCRCSYVKEMKLVLYSYEYVRIRAMHCTDTAAYMVAKGFLCFCSPQPRGAGQSRTCMHAAKARVAPFTLVWFVMPAALGCELLRTARRTSHGCRQQPAPIPCG